MHAQVARGGSEHPPPRFPCLQPPLAAPGRRGPSPALGHDGGPCPGGGRQTCAESDPTQPWKTWKIARQPSRPPNRRLPQHQGAVTHSFKPAGCRKRPPSHHVCPSAGARPSAGAQGPSGAAGLGHMLVQIQKAREGGAGAGEEGAQLVAPTAHKVSPLDSTGPIWQGGGARPLGPEPNWPRLATGSP